MDYLTVEDVQRIRFKYAQAHLTYDEPLPSFDSRFPDKLEAALYAPQRMVGGTPVYPTLHEQSAALLYEMVKMHPFLNGNKRMACVSLMTFLAFNGKWVQTEWRKLYDIAVSVADSKTENREGILGLLTEFIKNNLEDA